MNYLATITSKRQLTIPSALFKKAKLSTGDKILLEEKDGSIIFKPASSLVDELFGSVKIAKEFMGVDVDKAIQIAKNRYFSKKI